MGAIIEFSGFVGIYTAIFCGIGLASAAIIKGADLWLAHQERRRRRAIRRAMRASEMVVYDSRKAG